MSAPVDVLAWMELARRNLNGGGDSLTSAEWCNANDQAREACAAVAKLIDAASRHIHAVDHPVNDGDDAARQERTLRTLSAALARIGGDK